MLKNKLKIEYGIGTWKTTFYGREPQAIADPKFKKELLARGVFKEAQDGKVFYCGVLRVHLKNGGKIDVPDSGLVDVEPEDVAPESLIHCEDVVHPPQL